MQQARVLRCCTCIVTHSAFQRINHLDLLLLIKMEQAGPFVMNLWCKRPCIWWPNKNSKLAQSSPQWCSTGFSASYYYLNSGYVRATGTCLKSNGSKIIELHRTTTKKYHLLRDGTTQQRETEEFYDLQLTKGSSTSSIFSLPYRHSTKARAQLLFLDPGWSWHSDSPPPVSS